MGDSRQHSFPSGFHLPSRRKIKRRLAFTVDCESTPSSADLLPKDSTVSVIEHQALPTESSAADSVKNELPFVPPILITFLPSIPQLLIVSMVVRDAQSTGLMFLFKDKKSIPQLLIVSMVLRDAQSTGLMFLFQDRKSMMWALLIRGAESAGHLFLFKHKKSMMRGLLIHLAMSDDAALQTLYTKDDNMCCKQILHLHQPINIVNPRWTTTYQMNKNLPAFLLRHNLLALLLPF
ncbi:unnamed protein product [Miscanthus lutarioriparius]|uniref:Uncharacterized protein n=1 Tax=Miscanthus lutarioriparius TaxID=422564 RepID=A0A811RBP1_9POAL|nr:unnamed protein product [Miscanthus lutarioriparius]